LVGLKARRKEIMQAEKRVAWKVAEKVSLRAEQMGVEMVVLWEIERVDWKGDSLAGKLARAVAGM
jgi:hypothetical protein